MTNINDEPMYLYYQIDYTLTEVPDDAAYFHAQFRRSNTGEEWSLHTGRQHPGQGTICGHLPRLGRSKQWLVG